MTPPSTAKKNVVQRNFFWGASVGVAAKDSYTRLGIDEEWGNERIVTWNGGEKIKVSR
jgi:hypothetical protein